MRAPLVFASDRCNVECFAFMHDDWGAFSTCWFK